MKEQKDTTLIISSCLVTPIPKHPESSCCSRICHIGFLTEVTWSDLVANEVSGTNHVKCGLLCDQCSQIPVRESRRLESETGAV